MDFVDNNIQKVQVSQQDQVYAKNEDIKVYGKLVSMSTENVVADSEQIWDENLKKNQSDINADLYKQESKYLPLTGGAIDGNLDVTGRTHLGAELTLGDSLSITENNLQFEAEDNETLFLDYDGLTFSYGKTQNTGFKVKDGIVSANNITVVPNNDHSSSHSHSILEPDSLSISDGTNEIDITPTKISLDNGAINIESGRNEIDIHGNGINFLGRDGKDELDISSKGLDFNGYDENYIFASNNTMYKLGGANGVASLDANGKIPVAQLGNLDTQIAVIVQSLPTSDIKTNKIYLVPNSSGKGDNIYDEYIYVNNKWEKLGEYKAEVDLSNYAKLNGKNYFIETCEFANSVNFNSSVRFNNIVNGFTVEKKVNSYITAYNLEDRIRTKVFAADGSLFNTTTLAKKSDIKDYVLPTATTTALGGIKTNYTQNDKNYPVKVDDSGNAYVNVPWEAGTADLSGYAKLSGAAFKGDVLTVGGTRLSYDILGLDGYVCKYGRFEVSGDGSQGYVFLSSKPKNKLFAADGSLFDTTTLATKAALDNKADKTTLDGYLKIGENKNTEPIVIKPKNELGEDEYALTLDMTDANNENSLKIKGADTTWYIDAYNISCFNNSDGKKNWYLSADKGGLYIETQEAKPNENIEWAITNTGISYGTRGASVDILGTTIDSNLAFTTERFKIDNLYATNITAAANGKITVTSSLTLGTGNDDNYFIKVINSEHKTNTVIDGNEVITPNITSTDASFDYIIANKLTVTNGTATQLLAANGDLVDSTTLAKTTDLSNYMSTQGGKVTTEYVDSSKQYTLNVTGDTSVESSSGYINIEKTIDGSSDTIIKLDGADGSIDAVTGMFSDKVYAKGFLAKYNGSANEVWTTNGSKLNLLDIIKKTLSYTAIYVNGEIQAGPISSNKPGVDDVNDVEKIIFDSSNGWFVALKEGTYYGTWNGNIESSIEPAARYGKSASAGTYPYIDQVYRFTNGNLYQAKVVNNKYTLEEIKLS